MKKSMIEWILDVTEQSNIKHRMGRLKDSNKYERLHVKIDEQLFYCKPCNRVWQKNRKMMSRSWESYPSNHIPIIGKKRKECPNCEGKNDSI